MPSIVCPSCKTELQEYKRFCPECGTRIAELEAAPAPIAPTVILPPIEAPAAAPPQPGVSPTVRLDVPSAPTVLLPAADPPIPAPEPWRSAPQPTDPPIPAPEPWRSVAPAASDTPTMLGGQPPAPPLPMDSPVFPGPQLTATPGYPGGQLPTGDVPSVTPPRRTMWWIISGVGCLAVVLLLAVCVVGVLTLLGNRVESVVGTPNAPTAVGGAGGIVPDNSPLTGGAVLLDDNFENAAASGLGTEEDASSRYAYEDGAYVIEVKEAEKIVWAQVDGTYSNARFVVDTEIPPGADVAAAGLIFHYQDADNFYLFSVSNDGYYALEVLEGNAWTVLIDWTQSDAVDAVRNRMRVETNGDSITLYVNDELLETTSDGTFTQGEAALAVSSLKDSTAEVRFDNLLIELNE